MLDLEFLGSYDGPFDFIKGQLKLKAVKIEIRSGVTEVRTCSFLIPSTSTIIPMYVYSGAQASSSTDAIYGLC